MRFALFLLFISLSILSTGQPLVPPGKKLVQKERLVAIVNYSHLDREDTGAWYKRDSIRLTWEGENCSQQLYGKFPDMEIRYDRASSETTFWDSVATFRTVRKFNDDNKLREHYSIRWNRSAMKWDTLQIGRLTYDISGRCADSTVSFFNNEFQVFRDSIKVIFSYTNRDTTRTKMLMTNGSWENVQRIVTTGDKYGRLVNITSGYWDKTGNIWHDNIKDSISYLRLNRFVDFLFYYRNDKWVNERRSHFVCYNGRPVPELDSIESWYEAGKRWTTYNIKQRAFEDNRILKEFSCARNTVTNKWDTGSIVYYAFYKDTLVSEIGDMYWDKSTRTFTRYPYFNLLENDSMGMIVQLKSCAVKPGYIITETALIKYYYENFYLIVDAPPASSNKIQLYPNPSTGANQTTLVVPMTGSHRLTVSVKDLNGHNLFLSGFACQDSFAGTLPSGYWPAGIYLVTVFIDDVPQPTIKLIR